MWIVVSLIWIVVFLMLPVEVYDSAFWVTMLVGGAGTGYFLHELIRQYAPAFKSTIVIVFAVTILGFANAKSYRVRRNGLLEEKGKTTTAQIVDRESSRRKSKSRYYLVYRYHVNGQTYTDKDDVDFDVFFNFALGPSITIDYVDGRPSISRINKSSLIPDPLAREKFMKWQKEHVNDKDKD